MKIIIYNDSLRDLCCSASSCSIIVSITLLGLLVGYHGLRYRNGKQHVTRYENRWNGIKRKPSHCESLVSGV
jgi:hypothetical protein